MAAGGHFGWPKITFDHIFGHFRSIQDFLFCNFLQNGRQRSFWMSEIHFWSHFWSFQIDRPFWMSENNFRSHFWLFQIDMQLFFNFFLTKWPPAAILDGTTMSIIELARDIWRSNACVKFEERSLNSSKVIALTTKLCGGCGGVTNKNIIFPETCVSREYNYLFTMHHFSDQEAIYFICLCS